MWEEAWEPWGEVLACRSCGKLRDVFADWYCENCRQSAAELLQKNEELRQKNEELESKNELLSSWTETDRELFADVHLIAGDDPDAIPIATHKFVLAGRSPVFKVMLSSQMEEGRSSTILIKEVSHRALKAFAEYLYCAEVHMDEELARELFVLGEKYDVTRLKVYCDKFLATKLTWESSLLDYAFARMHGAQLLLEATESLLSENRHRVFTHPDFSALVDNDLHLMAEMMARCSLGEPAPEDVQDPVSHSHARS